MRVALSMWLGVTLAVGIGLLLLSEPSVGANSVVRIRPTEFTSGITNQCPIPDLVTGPDGNVWFAEYANHALGRITPQGQVTEFPIDPGDPLGFPGSVVVGPDGDLWSVTLSGRVARMTPQGQPTEFTSGITGFQDELASWSGLDSVQPPSITGGPDGNLWFTELAGTIGRVSPQGQVAEFSTGITDAPMFTAQQEALGEFGGITAGPDGNIWFTELRGAIGRITPQGQVTEFETGVSAGSVPQSIVAGPDGNLWFTELFGGRIGRVTPQGEVTEYPVGPGSFPQGIDVGPDGALWFAARGAAGLGRMTSQGELTLYLNESDPNWQPSAVTTGPGSVVWLARAGAVGRLEPLGAGAPAPATLDRRAPRARLLRFRGRRLTLVLSEPATVTARVGRHVVRWHLHRGRSSLTVPRWLARRAARRGVPLVLRDVAGNRAALVLRRR